MGLLQAYPCVGEKMRKKIDGKIFTAGGRVFPKPKAKKLADDYRYNKNFKSGKELPRRKARVIKTKGGYKVWRSM